MNLPFGDFKRHESKVKMFKPLKKHLKKIKASEEEIKNCLKNYSYINHHKDGLFYQYKHSWKVDSSKIIKVSEVGELIEGSIDLK
ncbi:hypothetical protein HFE03_07425 [Paenibacillus sp. EKM102P]|uniref:hypothetical protein n=1 Tax=unclassified Paenibacillus TaxID=185978 RepID=UPI00142E13E5|nr:MULTISPECIES: hypothetical protein [unclassified Paenibacillus]KAF6620476.1 hypothetical protein HFE00_05330 [Paenibacillus sp. EKM101P]KAF6623468.1 hypothetical protein HFE03_07425 [Paenibacillus sp. EKM102P]KAF6633969.1 hypothetical protein HFE01_07080 [Paenibacillus sp. EKM10P]KAF6649496.1 hypothetical protein HFE02_02045 [Paenibacillus sp. EKM11P]